MKDFTEVLAYAEFCRQLIPICSIFGGFALTAIVLERKGEPGTSRNFVVLLLMIASVSMIVAVCGAARYLYKLEMMSVLAEFTLGSDFKDLIASGKLNSHLIASRVCEFDRLLSISTALCSVGILAVFGAMAASGFSSDRRTGWGTLLVAAIGVFWLWMVIRV